MYKDGLGVDTNYQLAMQWFGLACDNGLQEGCDGYASLNIQ